MDREFKKYWERALKEKSEILLLAFKCSYENNIKFYQEKIDALQKGIKDISEQLEMINDEINQRKIDEGN